MNEQRGNPEWTSTARVEDVAKWVASRKRVVILTHVKPDGDAVGSTLAVTRAINLATRSGREYVPPVATPWYWGPLPDWFGEIVGETEHRIIDDAHRADDDPREEPDGVLILDTGSWSQLHEVREWLLQRTEISTIVDHHRQGDADVAPRRLLETSAAAACEPAAELCRLILRLPSVSKLPPEVASPLYMGLATDTGWFRHSNVRPSTMRLAAELLEAGADHSHLYECLEQRDRVSRLRLLGRALSSLEFLKDNQIALMTLRQQDFHDCHATPNDSGGFADIALKAAPVQVAAVITEAWVNDAGHITKISFRSKEGPHAVDVNEVARKLGGGGHIRASGAKVPVGIEEARRQVIEALR